MFFRDLESGYIERLLSEGVADHHPRVLDNERLLPPNSSF
jgi:hypothetical protein